MSVVVVLFDISTPAPDVRCPLSVVRCLDTSDHPPLLHNDPFRPITRYDTRL